MSTSKNWTVWLHEYLQDFPDKQDALRYALSRGLNAADCSRVAGWIDSIIMHSHDEEHIGAVRAEINQFMLQFPLYPGVE